jgi:hypothetical protein
VLLTSTKGPSFNNLTIQNTTLSGVSGTQVTDFTYTNGVITNSGTTTGGDESNIYFGTATGVNPADRNVSGVVTITGNTLSNAFEHGIDIQNFSGTISNATISGNTIASSTSSSTSHGSGIRLLGFGSNSVVSNITKATIANNTITNFPGGAGITAQYGNAVTSGPAGTWGTPGSPTNVISITGNTIKGETSANPMGANAILGTLTGGGQAAWNIENNGTQANPITNIAGAEIGITVRGASAVATADIKNNYIVGITSVGAQGIAYATDFQTTNSETPHLSGTISGNTITGQDGVGIQALATSNNNGALQVSILNNNVSAPTCGGCNRFGIRVDSGSGNPAVSGVAPTVCLDLSGNTSAGSGVNTGIGLTRRSNATASYTFNIKNLPAADGQSPQLESYINGLNPNGGGTTLVSATSGFGSCTIP